MKKVWEFIDKRAFYIMLLPGVLLFFVFSYMPIIGIILAFKDYDYSLGMFRSPWVGLKNFEFFFRTPDAWLITRNTVLYTAVFIVLSLVLAVSLAILINELKNPSMSKVYQTIALMPHFLSYVIVAYLVYAFLSPENGWINKALMPLMHKKPISWYSEPKYWPFILTFVKMWKGIGYGSIVYLAAITGISTEFYEAAKIDGATKWQQIVHITLPGLRSIMSIMLIMSIGGLFNADFGLFYQVPMNSGALFPTTNVLGTYVYRAMGNIGFSSAAGLYISVVGFILVCTANAIVKKIDEENAMF